MTPMNLDAAPSQPQAPQAPPTGSGLFSVGVAARRLNTKAATLRAWERRYGLRPSSRTPGGHRRYSSDDLRRLERMLDMVHHGVAAAEAAGAVTTSTPVCALPSVRHHAEELIAAMDALDAEAVTHLAASALDHAGAQCVWMTVFAPALVAIGERWESTGRGIEVEHMTSGLLETALRRHATEHAPAPAGDPCPVLLAATPDEYHTLPLTALAAALADHGHKSVLLGNLPGSHLAEAITRTQPHAVVLWARAPATADCRLLEDAARCTAAHAYPAGPGWPQPSTDSSVPHVLRYLPEAVHVLTSPQQTVPAADPDAP